MSLRYHTIKELTQTKLLDQFQGKPHITEAPTSLCADFTDVDLNPFG